MRDSGDQRDAAAFYTEIDDALALVEAVIKEFAGFAKKANPLNAGLCEEIEKVERPGKVRLLRVGTVRGYSGREDATEFELSRDACHRYWNTTKRITSVSCR